MSFIVRPTFTVIYILEVFPTNLSVAVITCGTERNLTQLIMSVYTICVYYKYATYKSLLIKYFLSHIVLFLCHMCISYFSAGTDFRRQNLRSVGVRF